MTRVILLAQDPINVEELNPALIHIWVVPPVRVVHPYIPIA
jgi:hypothetical protein